MTIGITGGAGFIGCNVAARYLNKGNKVVIFDNFSRKGTRNNLAWLRKIKKGRLEVIKGDIRTDKTALKRFAAGCDLVYHLAAQVAVTTSVVDPVEDFDINALGTFNVLEAVRSSPKKPPVVYASTNKVYGKMSGVKLAEKKTRHIYRNLPRGVNEAEPLDFYSPYGCSKGCGDQYVRDYARIYGLKTVVFRQSCIYGERQFGVEDQGWVAHFIISAVLGRPMTIYGDGKQVRDLLFVDDLVDAYEKAVGRIGRTAGQIYNIGGGPANTLSLLELLDQLNGLLGRKITCPFAAPRPGDQLIYVSDIGKARRDLGWTPGITVPAGIKRLHAWVAANKKELESPLR